MSLCRSCKAEVVWVITEAGRRMPLDPEPAENGNLVKVEVRANGDKVVRYANDGDPPEKPRYLSHFATCPNAADHRRNNS